jgi:hypothetical protein
MYSLKAEVHAAPRLDAICPWVFLVAFTTLFSRDTLTDDVVPSFVLECHAGQT